MSYMYVVGTRPSTTVAACGELALVDQHARLETCARARLTYTLPASVRLRANAIAVSRCADALSYTCCVVSGSPYVCTPSIVWPSGMPLQKLSASVISKNASSAYSSRDERRAVGLDTACMRRDRVAHEAARLRDAARSPTDTPFGIDAALIDVDAVGVEVRVLVLVGEHAARTPTRTSPFSSLACTGRARRRAARARRRASASSPPPGSTMPGFCGCEQLVLHVIAAGDERDRGEAPATSNRARFVIVHHGRSSSVEVSTSG